MSQQNHLDGAEFRKSLTVGLYEPDGPKALAVTAERSSKTNRAAAAEVTQWQTWRQQAHKVKAAVVANLDKLLVQFEQNLARRGVTVLYAENAHEANEHVLRIAKEHGVKKVVKAKSMVSEELDLNENFAAAGIQALETDLGEYLVQLAGQRPVHIVTPAMHLSAADCGRLFQEKLGEPFTADHQELTAIARKHLRADFISADMGISGVNFGIADTGSLVIVENEGNAGLSTSAPPVHVALMGIEKLLPRLADLPLFLNLLPRSGTGQKLTSYTHLIHGPVPGRKLYLILLDNGRTRVLADPLARAALHCVRCGTCLNNCPVYRRAGGWAYGWVYPGPIGSILTPHLLGMAKAGSLPFASSLCGACSEVCPLKIDIPHQLVHLRHRAVNEKSPANSLVDRVIWNLWSWAMRGPLRYRLTMWAVRIGVRVLPFVPWHPDKLGAWTRGRKLPVVPREPAFRTWWRCNEAQVKAKTSNAKDSHEQS